MILTVDEVKTHLRIEEDDEDAYIEGLIKQAQAAAEDFCRVSFDPYLDEEGQDTDPPEPVRLAVLLMVSHYYENRDNPERAVYGTMRIAFENLLYPYRDPDKMLVVCRVWASATDAGNQHYRSADVMNTEAVVNFTIRYRADVKPGMWVRFRGDKWIISTLGEYSFQNTYLGLKASLQKGVSG